MHRMCGTSRYESMDGLGTSPWKGEGRTMQEQLSRAMQEQLPREAQERPARKSTIIIFWRDSTHANSYQIKPVKNPHAQAPWDTELHHGCWPYRLYM
jgi:hypothetical protein